MYQRALSSRADHVVGATEPPFIFAGLEEPHRVV